MFFFSSLNLSKEYLINTHSLIVISPLTYTDTHIFFWYTFNMDEGKSVCSATRPVFQVSTLLATLYINYCWSAQGGILMGCNTATKQDLPCKKSCDKQQREHNKSQTLKKDVSSTDDDGLWSRNKQVLL